MAASSTDYLTIGGATIQIDSQVIGFTNDGIEAERTLEIKDFEDGTPMVVQLRVPIREKVRMKFPAVEVLDADKLSKVALNIPVTTMPGGAVVVAMGEAHSFVQDPNTGLWYIQLALTAISSLVVKNVAESTTYTLDSGSGGDYFLDATSGRITASPDGALSAGGNVHLGYHGNTIASKRLRLGVNNPLSPVQITLTHVSPNKGYTVVWNLWKFYFDGKISLNPKKTEFWQTESEGLAAPDPVNHPLEPVGYIDFIPPS